MDISTPTVSPLRQRMLDGMRMRKMVIQHFWRSEGGKETSDPGQDSHDAPDMSALWTILDTTPEGRGTDWYPKLNYPTINPKEASIGRANPSPSNRNPRQPTSDLRPS